MDKLRVALTVGLLLTGFSALATAQDECKTLYEVIHNHLPDLELSPVAVKILDNPALKGTFLMPHGGAVYNFLADLKAKGLTATDDLNAMLGPLMMYHFMQDTLLDLTTMTTNDTYKTAAHFMCGNNSLTILDTYVTKTIANVTFGGQAVGLGGNTTIVARDPIPFCGGNVYVVDTVLLPCGDGFGFVQEMRRTQPDCKTNMRHALAANKASHFMDLLTLTGVGQDLLYQNKGYTVFAPTNLAVAGGGWDTVKLKYDSLFATNKDLLKQLLMYYIVPTGAFKIADLKGKQFRTSMDTPPCTGGLLAVADDGKVVGQRYSAPVATADVGACSSIIHFIDHLVMPCCGTLEDILAGDATVTGFLDPGADLDLASYYRQVGATLKAVKGGGKMNIFVPFLEATKDFMSQAGKLTTSEVAEMMMYHMSESPLDLASKTPAALTTMLASVETPKVCAAKTGFKLQVESGAVEVASSAAIKGDPKIVNFNVAVKDGTEAAARVVYNISACDGNIIVINKFLMPCKVAKLAPGNPMVAPTPTSGTGSGTTANTVNKNTASGNSSTPAAGKTGNSSEGLGATSSLLLGLLSALLALLL